MDRHWFRFTGLTQDALKAEFAAGKGDGEILAWVEEHAQPKRGPWEILQWSAFHNERGPDGDLETLEFFAERVGACSKTREDVRTWFHYLDLDDLGYMKFRYASINDQPIQENERKFR